MNFFDSHAHLGDDTIFISIEDVLARAKAAGVKSIVNICTNEITLKKGLILAKKYPFIFNAAAVTPHEAASETSDQLFLLIEKHAKCSDLIAIGETGLDYFYYKETKVNQQDSFRRHMQLALDCHLPLIIHCRDAFEDLFHLLDRYYLSHPNHLPGILHCFTGTMDDAHALIARQWFISFSGIVTYKKSDELRKIINQVSTDNILIETDAPYLSPQTKRKFTNEPAFIVETAALIAQEKGLALAELANITTNNANRAFLKGKNAC